MQRCQQLIVTARGAAVCGKPARYYLAPAGAGGMACCLECYQARQAQRATLPAAA
jgi:hypothetical protein